MKFDKIIKDGLIEYGIINGNNTIVLIKSGANGSLYGYNNKYLTIATRINKEYGYTVICSSNPMEGPNNLDSAFKLIDDNYKDYIIYYMGFSNGGIKGIQNYNKYVKRLLLINPPLMLNIDKTIKGIKDFKGDKITFVFGTEDQSYKYVYLLQEINDNKTDIILVEGQDHLFSKNDTDFIELPFKYLV